MSTYALAFYDAFTATPFGGSQAAIILDTAALDVEQRATIAREIGMPATAFVDDISANRVTLQFFSTVQELPMCGHGTICLLTHLVNENLIAARCGIELQLPNSIAAVDVGKTPSGRYRVMLDINPPRFEPAPADIDPLLDALGLDRQALDLALAPEVAHGDFIHLVVPLNGLDAMHRIQADFAAIVTYCQRHGIETVALFCRATEAADATLHVRDFCPAVGVSESAAAGTTNAALTAYLLRHELLEKQDRLQVIAEQGLELGRPSRIESQVVSQDGRIERLQVGGIATRVFQGSIYL